MKIILADDHALFRAGLKQLLTRLGDDVSVLEANTHDAVLKLLAENQDADLALIDLHMPGQEYHPGLIEVLDKAETIPVVVLSGTENYEEIQQVINAGAMGFIPKQEHAEVMLCALQLVLSGGVYLPPKLMSYATSKNQQPKSNLTTRQLDVLKRLSLGYSNKEIGSLLNLSDATIKCHITAIFRALNVDSRMQAAAKAKLLGLVD